MTFEGFDADGNRKRAAAIVVGAGVAGMTAAHELASRGFKVHVVEAASEERAYEAQRSEAARREGDEHTDNDWLLPAVGGLARSQYFWSPRAVRKEARPRFGSGFGNRIQLKLAAVYVQGRGQAPLEHHSERFWAALDVLIGGGDELPSLERQATASEGVASLRLCWPSDRARLYLRPVESPPDDTGAAKPANDRAEIQDVAFILSTLWPEWLTGARVDKGTERSGRVRARIVAKSAEGVKQLRDSLIAVANQRVELAVNETGPIRKRVSDWLEREIGKDKEQIQDPDRFARAVPAWTPISANAVLLMWIQDPTTDLARDDGPLVAPGEHGYRFFPSFYEHVFDSMRRTYVRGRDEARASLHSGAPSNTVFDNLITQPVAAFGFNARADGSSPDLAQFDRAPGKSISDGLRLLQTFQREIGFETRDLLRYQARMLEYATSCAARRETYEELSWFEYIRADDGYSDAFVDALEHWPTALVGMRSREVDARTFGNAEVHILLDNVTRKDVCDATLNGPTSNAWFDPWRDYLIEEYDVTFHQDTAIALSLFKQEVGRPPRVLPLFMSGLGYVAPERLTKNGEKWISSQALSRWKGISPDLAAKRLVRRLLPTDAYVVLATSTVETYRLLHTLERNLDTECRDAWADEARNGTLRRMWDVLDGPDGERFTPMELRDAKLYGPLRHFVGAQFYDDECDLPFVRGHLFLPEHPWGLSAISQAQFGQSRRRRGWYPGILSFDIGSMHRPGPNGPAVWRSTRESLLDELWEALLGAIPEERGRFRLSSDGPRPRAHIDDGLSYLASLIAEYVGKDMTALPFRPPKWFSADADTLAKLHPDRTRTEWEHHFLDPWFLPSDRELASLFTEFVDPRYLDAAGRPTTAHRPLGAGDFASRLGALTPGFNSTPYLIVPPGDFACWPGKLDPADPTRGYDIVFDNLVLAGVHCRTFTRLATMESACESARHAVNGILRDADEARATRTGPKDAGGRTTIDRRYERTGYCDIFPLEEREPSWTQFWKAIDARLFAAGLPHMFEILKVDQLLKAALPSGARRTGPSGEEILDGLSSLLTDGTPDPSKLSSWASPLVLQLVSTFLHARRS